MAGRGGRWVGFIGEEEGEYCSRPQEGISVPPAMPGLPTGQNAAESLGRAGAVCPARLVLLGCIFEIPTRPRRMDL